LTYSHRQKTIIAVLLLALWTVNLAGCWSNAGSPFPRLTNPNTSFTQPQQESEPHSPTGSDADEIVRLRIAVPFGALTAEALRLLFLAHESGIMTDEQSPLIGHTIQLDELRPYDGPLELEVITVPAATGITENQVRIWEATNQIPDVMYCEQAAAMPGFDPLLELHEYLYEEPVLSPDYLYTAALYGLKRGHSLIGIPYLASTMLLCFDQSLLDELDLRIPPETWTWSEWVDTMQTMQNAITEHEADESTEQSEARPSEAEEEPTDISEKQLFAFENLSDILPFVAASLSLRAGWGMWDGGYSFAWHDPSFKTAASWLRRYAREGWSIHHLPPEVQEAIRQKGSLSSQNRCISWVADSSEIQELQQAGHRTVRYSLLPSGGLSDGDTHFHEERLPVQVRCLAISRTTRYPGKAVKLALFIALDKNALLMQNRYEDYAGLFPLVRDPFIQESIAERQDWGDLIVHIYERMDTAYSSGHQVVAGWDETIDLFIESGNRYLSSSDVTSVEESFGLLDHSSGSINE
jgi:hypothetical protein